MIIAFAGKKQSGKSTFAGWLEEVEFQRVSFASPLKNAIKLFLNKPLFEDLDKNEAVNVSFSDEDCKKIHGIISLPMEKIKEFSRGKSAKTIRELLQILGSDIIRNIDENWHTSQLKLLIDKEKDYVVDDLRFPNEKAALEKMGALCIYLIRPDNFEIDSHESEFALNWWDFDEWIINRKINSSKNKENIHSLASLLNGESFGYKLEGLIGSPLQKRNLIKSKIREFGINDAAHSFGMNRAVLVDKAKKLCIYHEKKGRKINRLCFSKVERDAAYLAGVICADGCFTDRRLALSLIDEEIIEKLRIYLNDSLPHTIQKKSVKNSSYKDAHFFHCGDKFFLENLKLWGLKPRKSQNESFPPILAYNKYTLDGLKPWIVGLIDGDGCIFIHKRNGIRIHILCSKEIALKIDELVPMEISRGIYKKKKLELYDIFFNGRFAKQFYEWLGRPDYGLKRKWDKIKNLYPN